MRNKKYNMDLKTILPPTIDIFLNLFMTILIPFMVYTSLVEFFSESIVGFSNYFLKFQKLMIFSTLIGASMTFLALLKYFQKPYSLKRLIFSCSILVLYCFYISLWAQLTKFSVNIETISLTINLSVLYLLFIVSPLILIIKKIYDFIILRKELNYKISILRILCDNKRINSHSQFRKYITKSPMLKKKSKLYLLRNLSKIMIELEVSKIPLIRNNKGYHLTRNGRNLLNYFEKLNSEKTQNHLNDYALEGLEVWTERDLKKLNKRNKN
ncbi:MAG: hypothetical protein ACFFB0_20070 [Promethearchaeota archaeon]